MTDDHPHHLDAALKHVAEAARKAQPFADRMMQKQMSAALPAMASAPKAKAEPQPAGFFNGVPLDTSARLFAPEPQSIEAFARKRAAQGCRKAKAELNRSN